MVKQVPDANPLKALLKQIEHLAAYATTYRYATTSGNIKPSPDDKTLNADMASGQQLVGQFAWLAQRRTSGGCKHNRSFHLFWSC